jgi:hypothetical protein
LKEINGYYMHFNARDTMGVSKKIDMQLAELRKYGLCTEINVRLTTKSIVKNMLAVFPGYNMKWDYGSAYTKAGICR